MADLTDKQARFVEEYRKDFNATDAARRAGYSEKTAHSQGPRLLANVGVQAALEKAGKAVAIRNNIHLDQVVQEQASIGFADIRKVVRWGATVMVPCDIDDKEASFIKVPNPKAGQGDEPEEVTIAVKAHTPMALIPSDEIDDATAAAIQEVSMTAQGPKVKMYPKADALKQLYAHLAPHLAAQQQAASNQTIHDNRVFIDARNQTLGAVHQMLDNLLPKQPA